MATLLTKQQIQAANDLKVERVPVPEWNGEVLVRRLTAAERDDFEDDCIADGKISRDNIRAKLCVRCMVDEDLTPIFDVDEFESLGDKSAAAVDRIFAVCQRLCGISENDIKELEKNSEAGPSESSTTG